MKRFMKIGDKIEVEIDGENKIGYIIEINGDEIKFEIPVGKVHRWNCETNKLENNN